MLVASRPVGRGQGPGQVRLPAVEEALHVGRPEPIADRLEPLGIVAGQEAVVEAGEPEADLPRLLLGPLVAVQADPHRVRQVGPDLHEARSPLPILDVEVVVVDGHRLPRELEQHATLVPGQLARLERARPLLGHPDEHHPLGLGEPRPVLGRDVVLPLPALELHDRDLAPRRRTWSRRGRTDRAAGATGPATGSGSPGDRAGTRTTARRSAAVGTYPFRYSRSMQSTVNVTRSRIMVSMLGVAIGASLTGG